MLAKHEVNASNAETYAQVKNFLLVVRNDFPSKTSGAEKIDKLEFGSCGDEMPEFLPSVAPVDKRFLEKLRLLSAIVCSQVTQRNTCASSSRSFIWLFAVS